MSILFAIINKKDDGRGECKVKRMKTIGRIAAFTMMLAVFPNVTSAASFTDVSAKHGAKQEIEYLVDKGVIKGFQDGTFKPQKEVTKANVATMLARALKLDLTNVKNPNLPDVPTTHTSYKEIAAVVNAGYMPGGEFKPYAAITRGEMARAITNAFGLKGDGSVSFSDVNSQYWAYKYIDALATNGITIGYEDGTFRPAASLTRAQFSSFLARALDPAFVKKNDASGVSTIPTVSASKKPVGTVSFNFNENYIYTYSTRTIAGGDQWHNEEMKALGKNGDGWMVWEMNVAKKATYKFQTRNTTNNFEYTLPQAASSLGGHVYQLPYNAEIGSTWEHKGISYKLVAIKDTHTTKAATFKNVYVVESIENNKKMQTYYANDFGEILKLTADGQVQRELIRIKLVH